MEGHAYTLKLNLAQLLRLRVAFHTLPLFHLRTFALKNYATVEINPKRRLGMSQNGHNQWQSKICQKIRKSCKNFVQLVIRPSKLI